MASTDQLLSTFTTRLRQLILQYKEAIQENSKLRALLSDKDKELQRIDAQMVQMQRDYDSLKMAKMLEISDGDVERAKTRVSKILRDINRCITYLNEK